MATNSDGSAFCGSCKEIVNSDDDALYCDGFCELKFHASCVSVTSGEFQDIFKLKPKIQWICDTCVKRLCSMKNHVVSTSEYCNLRKIVGNLMGLVRNIVNDNIVINNKLDKVSLQVSSFYSNDKHVVYSRLEAENIFEVSPLDRIIPSVASESTSVDMQMTSSKRILRSTKRVNKESVIKNQINGTDHLNPTKEITEKEIENSDLKISDVREPNEEDKLAVENDCESNSSSVFLGFDDFPKLVKDDDDSWKMVVKNKKKSFASKIKERNVKENRPKGQINLEAKSNAYPGPKQNRSRNRPKENVLIGTGDSNLIQGVKRAWFHLGKVKNGTSEEEVKQFLKVNFPNTSFLVERLDLKGLNESFKIGVDFAKKDEVAQSSLWPRNVTLKRSLFPKRETSYQR